MGEAYSTHVGGEKWVLLFSENLKRSDHLGDLGVDVKCGWSGGGLDLFGGG
jgi:hypothetical protein